MPGREGYLRDTQLDEPPVAADPQGPRNRPEAQTPGPGFPIRRGQAADAASSRSAATPGAG